MPIIKIHVSDDNLQWFLDDQLSVGEKIRVGNHLKVCRLCMKRKDQIKGNRPFSVIYTREGSAPRRWSSRRRSLKNGTGTRGGE